MAIPMGYNLEGKVKRKKKKKKSNRLNIFNFKIKKGNVDYQQL